MANSPTEPAAEVQTEREESLKNKGEDEEEDDEYVLLDLDEVFHGAALPSNCAYTISGLDTMNPVLILGDDLKLIGEYEETVGTVLVFTERDEEVPEDERIRGSNIKEGGTRKRVSNLCKMERKLKFRMMEKKESRETLVQEKRSRIP